MPGVAAAIMGRRWHRAVRIGYIPIRLTFEIVAVTRGAMVHVQLLPVRNGLQILRLKNNSVWFGQTTTRVADRKHIPNPNRNDCGYQSICKGRFSFRSHVPICVQLLFQGGPDLPA
ncbi:hypothetical protein SAMN06265374_2643 [Roseibium denhamense]|uniref:Secreted protein n=1 Tax=Roseibium denhamense TaxID=76305 RepID=A0ABY1P426_9HYPH|nr:hypothetical protein SAMN06265374_2643 [Roseibium denhamense]